MKRKSLVFVLIMVILFICFGMFYFKKDIKVKEKTNSQESIEKIDEIVKEKNQDGGQNIESDDTSQKLEEKEEIKEQNIVEEQQKAVLSEKQESTPKVETNNSNETTNNNPIVEETPTQPTAWEELGITENEYYNSPMWKWARVDFKINDYGNADETIKACRDKGNEVMEKDGLGFSCTSINSYSGKYLGEMFKTF